MTIFASFESRCDVCDSTIFEGDIITLTEDGEWVHSECGEDLESGFEVVHEEDEP